MVALAGAGLLSACAYNAADPCPNLSSVSASNTPVELSRQARSCLLRGDAATASLLFGVAKSFSEFDRLRDGRVASAEEQGWPGTMLPALIIRDGLEGSQVETLQAEIRALSEDPARHRRLCSLLRSVGPPTYPAVYGVDQNWRVVFPPPAERQATPAGFNAEAAWQEIQRNVVECPEAG
ncbi:MAG: hypothetical protein VKJ05_00360 [Synechococcaceae cyanobacterium]|nr:hypothetical protein [Synechococcaceae cyanobacterium]